MERTSSIYLGDYTALTVTTRHQKMYVDTRDISVAPHLMIHGYWEEWITKVFLKLLKPGMHLIDIGANFGYYTLLGAHGVGPQGRVTAFEANPHLVGLLKQSVAINGYESICKVVQKAVYSHPEKLSFEICNKFMGGSSLHLSHNGEDHLGFKTERIEVEATSLDDYLEASDKVDFIKMDAERSEAFILLGAENLLLRSKPIILMEYNDHMVLTRFEAPSDFLAYIEGFGYFAYAVELDSSLKQINADRIATLGHCDIVLSPSKL
ncbi:FkbM family methyltransferase [Polycladidibacter stylochi]|uniref:FkbM family methyltransferase n=1 Tax=Polycladidibacter stylochi TaxID=1807766 RepID=UPI00082F76D4|nr:FkbM family methyltransferase [Pseudovibrio stylochi]